MATPDPSPAPASPEPEDTAAEARPRTLYDYEQRITEAMDELSDLIPEEPSEPETEEQKARREAVEAMVQDLIAGEAGKIDGAAAVWRRLERQAKEAKEESVRLAKRAKAFEGKLARLGRYLVDVMVRWGARKLESTNNTFARQQNVDTVEVDDAKALPFEFQRWSFTFSPRTPEQLASLVEMLDQFDGQPSVEANKVGLKKHVQKVEAEQHGAVGVGQRTDDEEIPGIPPGVRMKPGTWRITLK